MWPQSLLRPLQSSVHKHNRAEDAAQNRANGCIKIVALMRAGFGAPNCSIVPAVPVATDSTLAMGLKAVREGIQEPAQLVGPALLVNNEVRVELTRIIPFIGYGNNNSIYLFRHLWWKKTGFQNRGGTDKWRNIVAMIKKIYQQ